MVKNVPTPAIFLTAAAVLLTALPARAAAAPGGKEARMSGQAGPRGAVLPEYPRPQLRRDSYLNLNGLWEYAITGSDAQPETFDGEILVPYSPRGRRSPAWGARPGLTSSSGTGGA